MHKVRSFIRLHLANFNIPGKLRLAIFRSARLKLTGFYLAIILFFSLALSLSVRVLAGREFQHEGVEQRGTVHELFHEFYSVPPLSDSYFAHFQNSQNAAVRRHLNDDVLIINIVAFVIGGILSYWYAGRTLKPIEEAHRAQSRFAADASHELRTPLASLRLENEIFLKQKKQNIAGAKTVIKSNLEEIRRLENLASDLLYLTQYENASLELKPLDVEYIVARAVKGNEKIAADKHIQFRQTVIDSHVLGHADSLIQLLNIIMDNAIKYSPAGSQVWVTGEPAGGRYNVRIKDEGPGITQADLPHIFERLYRGDKSRGGKIAGYGLGLSLAKEIARANQANVTVRNVPSAGAEFTISLLRPK